jgi:hypothetical protein
MADFTLSPNMGMPISTVGEAPGPAWATNIDASLSIVDSHNHSSGQGVQINPSGININTNFPLNNNNATTIRSVNFTPQPSPLALITDIGCLYVSGVDLYYNDESGNQIRITQSGTVAGSSGTITGLPSGTASASYSAGTFTFQGATNTPAAMNVGPVSIGNAVANSKAVTISPNAGIAANYNISLPAALPAAVNYVTLDNSGNLAFNSSGFTGTGAVVLQTTPSFPSGIVFPSGTMVDYAEGTWTPVYSISSGSATITTQAGSVFYQKIGNVVTCRLQININGPSGNLIFSITLPVAPNNNFSSSVALTGAIIGAPNAVNGSVGVQALFSTKNALIQWGSGPGVVTCVTFIYSINN